MIVFDYIFYRLTVSYSHFLEDRGITGQITVSLVQTMLIMNPVVWYFLKYYNAQERAEYTDKMKITVVVVMCIFFVFNAFRYRKRFDKLHERWKDESDLKKGLKFILVLILVLSVVFFLPVLVSIKDYTA